MALKFLNDGLFDGKVGIGTTSPNQLLEVAKSSGGATINISTDQSAGSQASKKYVTLDFSGYNNDVMARIQSWDESSSTSHGHLTFSTRKSGVGLSQAMLIDENGNVGIGTTNPTRRLEISEGGNGNSKEAIFRLIGTNTLGAGSSVSEIVSRQVVGGEEEAAMDIRVRQINDLFASPNTVMTLEGGGNVGIGVTAPFIKLQVGTPALTSGSAYSWPFDLTRVGSTSRGFSIGVGVAGGNVALGNHNGDMSLGQTFGADSNGLPQFYETMRISHDGTGSSGKVGIGTTGPTEKLEVIGNSITRSKTRGLGTNYATPEGWEAGAASTFNFREGFFGGNFINNGPSAENKVEFDDGPFGSRELVWMTVPEVGNDNDGGWDKTMNGFNNATNNGFMSVVYVRRDSGTASGSFYHGLSGQATNNLDGTANTNPYFTAGISVSTLPVDVWCVAIGIIYASSDSNTSSSGLGGVYRLDTGERISTATTFRQKSGATIQRHRAYHFYSTNTTAQLDFARPGFYILDGSEPTLSELTAGAVGGDDVFWSASGNDIYNDNTGKVGIGTTSPSAKLEITGSTPTAGDTTLNLKLPVGNVTAGTTEMGNILFSSTDESVGGSGSIAKISTIAGNGADAWIGQGRPTDLAFFTQPIGQTATLVEAMRITSVGHVNIKGTNTKLGWARTSDGAPDVVFLTKTDSLGSNGTAKLQGYDGITFHTTGPEAERMRIDSAGNVGIGTTNPGAQLDVAQPLANSSPIIRLTNTDASLGDNQVLGSLEFYQSDLSGGGVGVVSSIRSINENVFKGEAGLSFSTGATGGEGFNSLAERMRIDKDGNVGIGTTLPGAKLHIRKDDDTIYNPAADDGQRGVGATIQLNNNSTTNNTFGQIMYDSDTSGQAVARIVFLDAGNASSAIAFVTENGEQKGERMRIAADGKVGIGTDSPLVKFHVLGQDATFYSGTATQQMDIGRNSGERTEIFIDDNTNKIRAIQDSEAGVDFSFILDRTIVGTDFDAVHNFEIQKDGAAQVLVDKDGNVGIGTTDPTAPLQVVGIAEYTNNTTALAAGLTAGAFYRTGDLLKVVH